MTLWGVDLALALIGRLATHNAQGVELIKLEPDLDPAVHHTNMPIAILVVKVLGEIGWPHVIALVQGSGVIVDGPEDTGINTTVYPDSDAALDDLAGTLDKIATPWLADRQEELSVTDATLAVRIMLRRLDPETSYALYVTSGTGGPGGHVAARRDGVGWPAAITLKRVAEGVRISTSGGERVIRTMTELITGFEATELPHIKADVAWSVGFLGAIARAKAVASIVMAHAQRLFADHTWGLSSREGYFHRNDQPQVWLTGEGTRNVAGAVFESVAAGIHVSCGGGYDATFADASAAETAIDDILAGLKKSMMVVSAGGLREGHRYRVKRPMAGANAGEIVTFRGIQDQRFKDVWLFDKGGVHAFGIDDKDPVLDNLGDYLEPTP